MMSKEEAETVKAVYNRLLDSEEQVWTDIDDNLEMVGWMSDAELITESKIRLAEHSKKGTFRCYNDHGTENCFAPTLLEAVEAIVLLSGQSGKLHEKNAYILSYYLVMTEMNMIFLV